MKVEWASEQVAVFKATSKKVLGQGMEQFTFYVKMEFEKP